mmetsp:Transcript_9358/g.16962  ORF Transcript_9358/g.16962 Transcript_9358/m.16962 type:complete len:85 (+) Transcript_9358:579-833(+)
MQCNAMARDVWGIELNGKAMKYPIRYQLDIAAQKEWYEKNGVEQIFIIVVRDEKISFAARYTLQQYRTETARGRSWHGYNCECH